MSKFKPNRESAIASADLPPAVARRSKATKAGQLETTVISSAADLQATTSPAERVAFNKPPNGARQFAFNCTLLFLYFRFSFVHEFLSSNLHIDTHILIILGTLCYLSWFVAGGIFAAFSDRLAWVWVAFIGWICLACITSTWRGGSLGVILPYLRTIFPLLLLIPAVISSIDDIKKMLNVIGLAGTTTVLFGLIHRDISGGRMDIGTDGSSIQDPNDYALHLIVILPAIVYVLFAKQRPMVVKLFGVGVVLAALMEIMSTGSRGGFVALLLTSTYIALTGSTKLRAVMFLGVPTLALLALPFVPKESIARLESLVDSSQATESAAASSDARRALLMASLAATAHHPLTGVGPVVFMDYEAVVAAEYHQKGMWHETHNGYTQISSECGIPALILYLSAVVITFKSLRKASRLNDPVIPMVANTLMTMLVGFSSALIFLAQGYRFTPLVIGAITIAVNQLTVRSEPLAQQS